jgi:hypothetical protein
MDIAELKRLEANATPGPWKDGIFIAEHNIQFLNILRNLAPELIALAEAALKLDGAKPGGLGLLVLPDLFKSMFALQEKMEKITR